MDPFRRSVVFLWPEDPRQAYVQDQSQGLYSFSDLFCVRTSELGCWRMSRDFLNQFPELSAVIPCSNPSLLDERLLAPLESDMNDEAGVADWLLC